MHIANQIAKLGTESAFQTLARAEDLKAMGRDIINLGIGQPDFSTPIHIVEAAHKALADGHHGYTPANGIRPLREAVASDLYRRHATEVHPDQVVIVPGGKVTMFFAILIFGEAGAQILYPDPGFPIYRSLIEFSGATPVPIRLHENNNFSFRATEVLEQIRPETRLIILNSPANPTGGATAKEELDSLINGLEAHPEVVILSDEIYSQLLYDGHEHISLLTYESIRDRTILLDGWSKTYAMTGWRLGYGIWPPNLVEAATRLAVNDHSCVSSFTQFAGIAALTGPQDSVAEMRTSFDKRRGLICKGLNSIHGFQIRDPVGAFYAFANITGSDLSSTQLEHRLLEEAGVATVSGTSFGTLGEGYLRFSYANSSEAINEALIRVRALVER